MLCLVRRLFPFETFDKLHTNMLRMAFILLAVLIQGNNLLLSPKFVDEWENTSVTLTCSYEGQLQGSVQWILTIETKTFTAGMRHVNNLCEVNTGWLSNNDQYSYDCTNRNVFNLTLKRISRQQHGDKLACIFYLGNTPLNRSNTVNIAVKVPVEIAILSPNNSRYPIPEGSTYSWQCATFHVRPKPNFWWYIDNDTITSEDEILLTSSLYSDTSSDVIENYTMSSSFKLNRTWNSRFLYCGASNRDNDIIFSQKIVLNVTYPPDDPPRIGRQTNGSEVNVIKGMSVTLNCTVTTGNPIPRLEWSRHNDQPQTSSVSFVTKNISWLPTGNREEALICKSIHPDKVEIMFVIINVLYPPENVLIHLQNKNGIFVNVTNSISVIEGRQFLLNCSANSNPAVSIYEWSGLIAGNSSDLRVADRVKRNQTGQLICRVFNIMKLSEPLLTIYGNKSSSLDINVLYPPTVNTLKHWTVVEGDDLVYSCNATPGNPNISNFTWKWGSKQWDTQQLALKNVSRNQSGTYSCIVSNLMMSSDGDESYGTDFGEFNLTVQYKANVRMFVMEDHETNLSVTVTENETVSLACEIEGNPLPDGELFVQHTNYSLTTQLKVTNVSSESTELLHLKTTLIAQCFHAGTLTCVGNNTMYTGEEYMSTKTMTLKVNCKPRKSPFHEIRDTVVSPTSVPATIFFTTLAYPIPPTSGYVWSRNTKSTMQIWIKIENYDTSYTITTSGLQSDLIIKNVSQFDFGLYRVEVRNDFGSYTHTFKLVAGGKPEAPMKLECIDELTNETSATLQWMPAFNGGLDQTFFLMLKEIDGDTWHEETVTDQRSSRMIYTFYGLVSGTSYVFEIYASNKLGNSSSVKITFTTRARQSSKKGIMSSSTPVGAVVGGAIAATVVLAILIIFLIFYRKRKALSSQNAAMADQYYNMSDLKCVDFNNSLNCGSRSSNVYESLQNSGFDQHYEQISLVDCKLDKGEHKIYENLQLTRNAERHPARESSRPGETVSFKEQNQSSA